MPALAALRAARSRGCLPRAYACVRDNPGFSFVDLLRGLAFYYVLGFDPSDVVGCSCWSDLKNGPISRMVVIYCPSIQSVDLTAVSASTLPRRRMPKLSDDGLWVWAPWGSDCCLETADRFADRFDDHHSREFASGSILSSTPE